MIILIFALLMAAFLAIAFWPDADSEPPAREADDRYDEFNPDDTWPSHRWGPD